MADHWAGIPTQIPDTLLVASNERVCPARQTSETNSPSQDDVGHGTAFDHSFTMEAFGIRADRQPNP